MKRKIVVSAALVALATSGCATQMGIQQQAVILGGKTFHYVAAEAKDASGVNFVVLDRYDENGKLLARDAASGAGILQAVVPALIDGAATAGGLIGAASVLRPDTTTTNVTQTSGGEATNVSVSPSITTSNTNSNKNSNKNSSVSTSAANAVSASSAAASSNASTNQAKPKPKHKK